VGNRVLRLGCSHSRWQVDDDLVPGCGRLSCNAKCKGCEWLDGDGNRDGLIDDLGSSGLAKPNDNDRQKWAVGILDPLAERRGIGQVRDQEELLAEVWAVVGPQLHIDSVDLSDVHFHPGLICIGANPADDLGVLGAAGQSVNRADDPFCLSV